MISSFIIVGITYKQLGTDPKQVRAMYAVLFKEWVSFFSVFMGNES